MPNEVVINATSQETRIALIENGTIAELYVERSRVRGIVGNIYKGKVIRVLPGMQAAFVDIGLEKAAFLYVADVFEAIEDYETFMEGNNKGEGE
ncbi:MAG TPA: Rne/Rng family ribonuclease, partial [Geobacteraceae bacterium]|nr:Rne/Rng family ribonuclease [Geobacteraceae bacterium]